MPRFGGSASRGFGASGGFPGGRGSAVAVLEYAAQERVMAQYLYEHAGVPTDGTNGTYAHIAPPGALLINTDAKTLYQNTNTQDSPVWTERSASGGGSGFAAETTHLAAVAAGSGHGFPLWPDPLNAFWNDGFTVESDHYGLKVPVAGRYHYDFVAILDTDTSSVPHSIFPQLQGGAPVGYSADQKIAAPFTDEQRLFHSGYRNITTEDVLYVAVSHDGDGTMGVQVRLLLQYVGPAT
jgi:hypothetical protein